MKQKFDLEGTRRAYEEFLITDPFACLRCGSDIREDFIVNDYEMTEYGEHVKYDMAEVRSHIEFKRKL
jgi:hypothetical protein